jgi:membrane protein required for colicin V production
MAYLSQFTQFDIAVLAISGLLIGRGIWVGCIKQLASILALIVGFVAAGRFCEDFYQTLLPFLSNPTIAFFVSYLVLFVIFYLGFTLLGMGLKKVIDIAMLGWFDRAMGGLLGAVKAMFVAVLVFTALSSILSGSNNFLRKSFTYPYLSSSSGYILRLIKDVDLRSSFLPKEPAVQKDLPPVERKEPVED